MLDCSIRYDQAALGPWPLGLPHQLYVEDRRELRQLALDPLQQLVQRRGMHRSMLEFAGNLNR